MSVPSVYAIPSGYIESIILRFEVRVTMIRVITIDNAPPSSISIRDEEATLNKLRNLEICY